MSVRYDPLLARSLSREILARWGGLSAASIGLDRGRRTARISFEDGSCLLATLHPAGVHLLGLDSEAESPLEGVGGGRRFRRLPLSSVEVPEDERALVLVLAPPKGEPREALALELHTNRWNALDLTRAGEGSERFWRIETALVARDSGGRSLRRGARYEPPRSTRRAIDAPPTEAEWTASLADLPADERRTTLLRTWAWSSALNVGWILGEPFDPGAAFARYLELRELGIIDPGAAGGRGAWLLERPWGPQPYPLPLGTGKPVAGGLLAAFGLAADADGGLEAILSRAGAPEPALEDEGARLRRRLRSRHKRAVKRLRALERQLAGAASPDAPREVGHLILARKTDVPRGSERVTLEGFDGSPREVELDPALDAVANAERYFDEAKRRERAAERLPSEIRRAEARRDELREALRRLEEGGPSEELWKLVGDRPQGRGSAASRKRGDASETSARLPYTRLMSTGGLEIRVGRGARDNDDLTFRHSAPDDIWLHASQASGAHVILRWGRKDENPPQRDLAEAAMTAAVNSGARHSGTVAVVWTRRKYVRKPRKSPPGTVVPERVKTIFVEPDEERVRALASR